MSPAETKSPISEKQLEANRRNAQLSTGPRTEEGKRRSALNARRHGLTGQLTVMTPTQREAHDLFLNEFIGALAPACPIERNLAEAAGEDSWRLKRLRALEENIYALGHPDLSADSEAAGETSASQTDNDLELALAHARSFMADPKKFQLLTLYEQRLHRSMQNSLTTLREMQTARKTAHAQALEEALVLAQLAENEGRAYDPAQDSNPASGFVFSTAEIKATINHRRRVMAARAFVQQQQRPVRMPNAA